MEPVRFFDPFEDPHADGKHTVQWRAVSADGHPIDGICTFTYAAEEATHSESAAPSTPATAATTPATPAANAQAPETQASAPAPAQTTVNTGLFIGIGAVLLILVAVGAYLIGRRAKPGSSNN